MRIGIDEAGRGALIGPMIVAGVAISDSKLKFLKGIGVKDSKQLTRERREKLFDIIAITVDAFTVVKVFPYEIDNYNLNDLTYDAVSKIILSLSVFNPEIVTVDKVGEEKPVIELIRKLGYKSNVVHKADVLFVEASAASIIAKVIRDNYIDELKKVYGDFGSGYPADPRTIKWLKSFYEKNPNPPPIVRRSWKILRSTAPLYYISKEGRRLW
ncbi:ribonuclease HII [Sulfolobus islandicus Y.N.15.51]|jgi:ribonuclease HII|uniref:Ribonuclease HII n=1 Tax=Saccharolobus islandicus (strain Y.N.15.51 / Yellowstone \|nr:ribonuclease HII [Sulfolobus islandicus]ACP49688.1 ribonuclease HII [Sulfolobus islandicus Y.N.15.51]